MLSCIILVGQETFLFIKANLWCPLFECFSSAGSTQSCMFPRQHWETSDRQRGFKGNVGKLLLHVSKATLGNLWEKGRFKGNNGELLRDKVDSQATLGNFWETGWIHRQHWEMSETGWIHRQHWETSERQGGFTGNTGKCLRDRVDLQAALGNFWETGWIHRQHWETSERQGGFTGNNGNLFTSERHGGLTGNTGKFLRDRVDSQATMGIFSLLRDRVDSQATLGHFWETGWIHRQHWETSERPGGFTGSIGKLLRDRVDSQAALGNVLRDRVECILTSFSEWIYRYHLELNWTCMLRQSHSLSKPTQLFHAN